MDMHHSTDPVNIFNVGWRHPSLKRVQLSIISLSRNDRIFHISWCFFPLHYYDVIMGVMASQITSLTIVSSTVHSGVDKKNQSSASLAFVRGIHRGPMISPHKGPVTRKMFTFDDVLMWCFFPLLSSTSMGSWQIYVCNHSQKWP